jgi:hypothetical protein
MADPDIFNMNDMVLTTNKAGEIVSGNFNFNEANINLHGGQEQEGEQGSFGGSKNKNKKEFEDLAIPAGLYYFNKKVKSYGETHKAEKDNNDNETIPESLYEKLLGLVEEKSEKKKKNKKYTKNKKGKTEINKNNKKKTRRQQK